MTGIGNNFKSRGPEFLWLRPASIAIVSGQKILPQFRHGGREAPAGIQHAGLIVVLLPSARADMTQQRGSHDHQVEPIGRQRRQQTVANREINDGRY
jgi:hypothetical protein